MKICLNTVLLSGLLAVNCFGVYQLTAITSHASHIESTTLYTANLTRSELMQQDKHPTHLQTSLDAAQGRVSALIAKTK